MLRNFLSYCAIGCTIYIVLRIFKVNYFKTLYNLLQYAFYKVGNFNFKTMNKTQQAKVLTTKKSFHDSFYYKIVNSIIVDLDIREYATVEGLTSLIAFICFVIAMPIGILLNSVFLLISSFILWFVLSISILYMISRNGHEERENAIMDTIDLLINNIERGVLASITENVDLINPLIREHFEIFIVKVTKHNYSFRHAMTELNETLGDTFTDFAKKAIQFEENETEGMKDIFLDNIDYNSETRAINAEKNRFFTAVNNEYLIAIGLLGVLALFYLITTKGLFEAIAQSAIYKGIIVANFILIIGSFAWMQYLRVDIRKD